ncbi:MAG: YceK/YidQ family lipoprotein [Planctomycetes bacterium]|nr:YceK/YidQ family lipoprotein [Planctomycetota bacterium]
MRATLRVAALALALQLTGCMTCVQTLVGELPAALGGTRLWAQDYSADVRWGGLSAGRYVFLCGDLPLSLLADLLLLPVTIPCELLHDGPIELFEFHVSPL